MFICPLRLSTVATVLWKIQKSHFSTVLFVHTSYYLRYLRRKQTVTSLPTTRPCKMLNFFVWLKVMLHSSKRWWLWKEPVVICGMSGKQRHNKCSKWPPRAPVSCCIRLRASGNDRLSVCFKVTISCSVFHLGQDFEKERWFPEQWKHFIDSCWHSLSLWFSPQQAHLGAWCLHFVAAWPYKRQWLHYNHIMTVCRLSTISTSIQITMVSYTTSNSFCFIFSFNKTFLVLGS